MSHSELHVRDCRENNELVYGRTLNRESFVTTPSNARQSHYTWLESLKDSVTTLGGVAALAAVLLWYLGRRYGSGYFHALNIPFFEVDFSIWEYGEVSIHFFMIGLMIVPFFVAVVYSVVFNERSIFRMITWKLRISLLAVCLLALLVTLSLNLTGLVASTRILISSGILLISFGLMYGAFFRRQTPQAAASDDDGPANRRRTASIEIVDAVPVVVLLFLMLGFLSTYAYEKGESVGKDFVARIALHAKMTLDGPLIDNSFSKGSFDAGGKSLHFYQGLRLLLHNNKRYYFFSDVGVDGRPQEVYVVPEDHVQSISYAP